MGKCLMTNAEMNTNGPGEANESHQGSGDPSQLCAEVVFYMKT